MSKILKTIIICVCLSVMLIAAGLFGLYKFFVTPERIIQLALVRASENLGESFTAFNDDEKDLLEDILGNGANTELSFSVENVPLLEGKKISVTSDSDTVCSVTDIDAGDFSLSVYKDSEQFLINTSLFSGGFCIPTANLANEWNESVFKDLVEIPVGYSGKDALSDFAKGRFDLRAYQRSVSDIVNDILTKNPIEKDKKSAVVINGKAKKANSYTVKVTKADAERFLMEIPADYALSCNNKNSPERIAQIQEYFSSFADDYEVTLKIYDKNLRGLEIKNSEGDIKTITFEGEDNPFDVIEFYKNDDSMNSIRRVRTVRDDSVDEKIYVSDKVIFELENNTDNVKMHFDNDIVNVSLDIYGKKTNKDSIILPDIRLNINDTINVSAECIISKYFDRDFAFEKTGQYVNILDISQEEWDIVFNSLFGVE